MSAIYTPTTEEVRGQWGYACQHCDPGLEPGGDPDAEFDRWLTQHDREVTSSLRAAIAPCADALYALDDDLTGYEDPGEIDADSVRYTIQTIATALYAALAGTR